MQSEKKFLPKIPAPYKRMQEELVDYRFFYFLQFLFRHYTYDSSIRFLQALCDMFKCDKSIVMNLIVDMRMYPEKYRHDVRHVAFLMYAMDVNVADTAWTLRTTPTQVRTWTKQQLQDCPEIKRLFTDAQTGEIMKMFSAWNALKGLPI